MIVNRDLGDETDYVEPKREPICGEDFCDRCGDCLVCDAEFECLDGGSHMWVRD